MTRLCKKCLDFIRAANFTPNIYFIPTIAEENECEFWAHAELNRISESFERHALIPDATWD